MTEKSKGKSTRPYLADHPEARGRGPKKGAPNAGRPPDKFKAMCQGLASSPDAEQQVAKIIRRGSKDPMFVHALRWASEHGYGKPAQSVTHEVGGNLEDLILRSMGLKPTTD